MQAKVGKKILIKNCQSNPDKHIQHWKYANKIRELKPAIDGLLKFIQRAVVSNGAYNINGW